MTSSRARPLPKEPRKEGSDNRITPARLKLYVLGNLLDCAVQTQDLQKRRVYIERIMSLTKNVQKILMALIEKRGPKRSSASTTSSVATSSSTSSSLNTQTTTTSNATFESMGLVSPKHVKSLSSKLETPTLMQQQEIQRHRASIMSPPPSKSASKMSASNVHLPNRTASLFSPEPQIAKDCDRDDEDEVQTNASSATECRSNTSSSRVRASRLFSAAFGPKNCTGYTPDQKRCFSGTSRSLLDNDDRSSFLSPGIMDSPNRLAELVHDLSSKNEEHQQTIDRYKERDENLSKKLDELDAEHRRKLMRLESNGLDRIQEIQQSCEEKIESMKNELEAARIKARDGVSALHELKMARDELEILNHGQDELSETKEKLKKYKEKVSELQDVKEALKREQSAHSNAVEEIVRLENEVKTMHPLKRQVEEYKFRAVEAEVKLVESQDYLRRLEKQANDQTISNQFLRDGVLMQKEQLEEIQRRIQLDTINADKISTKVGVGDGINELNPELSQELVRLRNENLQLRAFAMKREVDAVQHLEESLDDAKRLAERYKQQFLELKEQQSETLSMLQDSRRMEIALKKDTNELRYRLEKAEHEGEELSTHLLTCESELDNCKKLLSNTTEEKSCLQNDFDACKKKLADIEKLSNDRMERLRNVLGDLEETTSNLRSTEQLVQDLREEINNMEDQATKNGSQMHQMRRRIQLTSEELNEAQVRIQDAEKRVQSLESQTAKLSVDKINIQEQLKLERRLRHEDNEESQQSLEATRQVLEARHKKEMEELQSNMNVLLEDERKAVRQKEDEAKRKFDELQKEWNKKCEEIKSDCEDMVAQVQEEANDTGERARKELQEQLDKERKESSETHDRLIRKGKAMLEEAKTKARDEINRLDGIVESLQEKNSQIERERYELENLLQSKISSLKQSLEFSTNQLNSMSQEADDFQEQTKLLEREKVKLNEENERFRRQLGGRFGADGKVQSTLDTLQREYNTLLEENRKLKTEIRQGGRNELFADSVFDGNTSQPYRQVGSVNGTTLAHMRQEYEETIDSLNDEKRELIMRNSAAITDVQKAEQRVWEREQDISKLKAEITSLKLAMQRDSLSRDHLNYSSTEHESLNRSKDISTSLTRTPPRGGPQVSYFSETSAVRSPSIERARQQKAAQENDLINRFSSLSGVSRTRYNRLPPGTPDEEVRKVSSDDHASASSSRVSVPNGASKSSASGIDAYLDFNVEDQLSHSHSTDNLVLVELKSSANVQNVVKSNEDMPKHIDQSKKVNVENYFETSEKDEWEHYQNEVKLNKQKISIATEGTLQSNSSLTSIRSQSLDDDDNYSMASNEWSKPSISHSSIKQSVSHSSIDQSLSQASSYHQAPDSMVSIDQNESQSTSYHQGPDQMVSQTNVDVSEGPPATAKKHEGRFDRWTKGLVPVENAMKKSEIKYTPSSKKTEVDSTTVRDVWKGNDRRSPFPEETEFSSPTANNETDSTSTMSTKRKSANFKKAASIFETAAAKNTLTEKSLSQPSKNYSPNRGVATISKKMDGINSDSAWSASKKHENSSSSSAFKMASAVFEVGVSKSQYSIGKSPAMNSNSPNKYGYQKSQSIHPSVNRSFTGSSGIASPRSPEIRKFSRSEKASSESRDDKPEWK